MSGMRAWRLRCVERVASMPSRRIARITLITSSRWRHEFDARMASTLRGEHGVYAAPHLWRHLGDENEVIDAVRGMALALYSITFCAMGPLGLFGAWRVIEKVFQSRIIKTLIESRCSIKEMSFLESY